MFQPSIRILSLAHSHSIFYESHSIFRSSNIVFQLSPKGTLKPIYINIKQSKIGFKGSTAKNQT